MKLPNGYGSVTKLSGNRRKPYVARISSDPVYDDKIKGYKPKRTVLGYYPSKKEALNALAEYNMNPFNLDQNNITFREVYGKRIITKICPSLQSLCVRPH